MDEKLINITTELNRKIWDWAERERTVYPVHANRSSQLGHPCLRFLVYLRTRWQDMLKPDTELIFIFNEGNLHEQEVIMRLQKAGIDFVEAQRPFYWKEYNISGRIDGKIKINNILYPVEIKSMSPYHYNKINSMEDIKNSEHYYIRGYYTQINLYMLMNNIDKAFMILKNKVNGQIKFIPVELDYDEGEKALKTAEAIEKHVKDNTLPDKLNDPNICLQCPFRHICEPNFENEGIKIEDAQSELAKLLKRREELEPIMKEYKEVDNKIKEIVKSLEEKAVLVDNYYIEKKTYTTTKYNIPKEVKSQYAQKVEQIRINIKRIADEDND